MNLNIGNFIEKIDAKEDDYVNPTHEPVLVNVIKRLNGGIKTKLKKLAHVPELVYEAFDSTRLISKKSLKKSSCFL